MQIFGINFEKKYFMKDILDIIYLFKKPLFITTPNNEFMLESLKNERFKKIIEKSDIKLIDSTGMFFAFAVNDLKKPFFLNKFFWAFYVVFFSIIYFFSLIFLKKIYFYRKYGIKITGTDFIDFISKNYNQDVNIYIIGSSFFACNNFKSKYMAINKNIKNVYFKTFDEIKKSYDFVNFDEEVSDISNSKTQKFIKDLVDDINNKKADFVYVALSAPQSAYVADYIFPYIQNIKFIIGCGGAIDYLGGEIKRAPKWMRVIGIEFLYRLIKQPKKRIYRIYNALFVFTFYVVWFKINEK